MMQVRDRLFKRVKKTDDQSVTDLNKKGRNQVTTALKKRVKLLIIITTFSQIATT